MAKNERKPNQNKPTIPIQDTVENKQKNSEKLIENVEFAKEAEVAKINPNFDIGEIKNNELHKSVNHSKNRLLGKKS